VGGGERIRLFCGLRLPDEALERLVAWQTRLAAGGRLVTPGNLHVTLAFLGHVDAARLPDVVAALRDAAARSEAIGLTASGYRETRSVGMVVLEDEGGHATALADDLHGRLERLGLYRREGRPWLPHVTVLRFRERPRLRPDPPDLGRVAPSDAAAFLSRLGPSGARYEVLESVALGG
jgi:RNA 2',3'-cyclic 3'-phosphodiesterase